MGHSCCALRCCFRKKMRLHEFAADRRRKSIGAGPVRANVMDGLHVPVLARAGRNDVALTETTTQGDHAQTAIATVWVTAA
jgi:hypothetical protein